MAEALIDCATTQTLVPTRRLHCPCHTLPPGLLPHAIFSKPNTSAGAEEGSLQHDAPGAIISPLLTTVASLLPPASSPTPLHPAATHHVLHPCARGCRESDAPHPALLLRPPLLCSDTPHHTRLGHRPTLCLPRALHLRSLSANSTQQFLCRSATGVAQDRKYQGIQNQGHHCRQEASPTCHQGLAHFDPTNNHDVDRSAPAHADVPSPQPTGGTGDACRGGRE